MITSVLCLNPKYTHMKNHLRLLLLMMLAYSVNAVAQVRYLDEVFSSVTVNSDVTYGANVTIITGAPTLDTLKMDVYEPDGDTAGLRPLIVYLHTGSFLPVPTNGQCTGDKLDSASVEMCMRFAKKGYVTAAINYRLGWNPLGDQDTRTGTLLNAVYRAIQDAKSAVRYFRSTIASGNPYKIDDTKIILGGQGSGGYVALAYATIDDYADITLPKFINLTSGQPYVDTTLSGDWDGNGGTGLNQPALNNPGFSNDIHFVFNMGGALGDSTWLKPGDVPMVCFHVPNDPFAPYMYGPVFVPTTQQFVVNVSGSHHIIQMANAMGNNNSFINLGLTDPFTVKANVNNDGLDGLYPLLRPVPPGPLTGEAGPWEWWDPSCVNHTSSLASNPDMSKAKGMAYIDTVQGYLCPRMYYSLGLNVGVNEVALLSNSVKVYPNPTAGNFTISLVNTPGTANRVTITDMAGRIIRDFNPAGQKIIEVERKGLSAGLYMLNIEINGTKVIRQVSLR